jgi:hypothetical protein
MPKKSREQVRKAALERVEKIRSVLQTIDFATSGTLLERRKVCGKPGCRCTLDPSQRHGPYYEWTRRHGGTLLHRVVTPEQAQMIRQAIKNHRDILKLLKQWERETVSVIESLGEPNSSGE